MIPRERWLYPNMTENCLLGRYASTHTNEYTEMLFIRSMHLCHVHILYLLVSEPLHENPLLFYCHRLNCDRYKRNVMWTVLESFF